MPTPEVVVVERDGSGVVVVTINRPRTKNAIPLAGWLELSDTFREIAASAKDRAVIVTGAAGNFSSGADLSEEGSSLPPRRSMQVINDACAAIRNVPQPTVAAVSGYAVGAGFNLVLSCDLAIADSTARFSQIFVKRGLSVDFGGTWQLPRVLGLQRAKELAFFGRTITADELFELGALNRVVTAGDALPLAREWAVELAQLAPVALSLTKEMINQASSATFAESLAAEAMAQNFNVTTHDTREAVDAFRQGRVPVFQGN